MQEMFSAASVVLETFNHMICFVIFIFPGWTSAQDQ
jgi:hypothetical protein